MRTPRVIPESEFPALAEPPNRRWCRRGAKRADIIIAPKERHPAFAHPRCTGFHVSLSRPLLGAIRAVRRPDHPVRYGREPVHDAVAVVEPSTARATMPARATDHQRAEHTHACEQHKRPEY